MNDFTEVVWSALAVAWKDMQVLAKDRGQLIVFFVLPLLMGSMLGSISNQSMREGGGGPQLPVYLVNQDDGPYGAQITDILRGIEQFDIEELDSPDEADRSVGEGDRIAAIIIPPDFSANVDAYQPSTVQVLVDPAQEEFGSLIAGAMQDVVAPVVTYGEVQYGIRTILQESGLFDSADPAVRRAAEAQSTGALMTQLQAMQQNPPVAVVSENTQGVEVMVPTNAFSLTMPTFTVWFAFFIVGTVAETLLREREEGTLRRLVAAPISRGAIIAGKMLAYLVIAVLQVLLIFGIGNIVFDMSLGRSPLGLLLITVALGLAATSMGMLLAGVARSSRQAGGIGMVLGFVLAGLGGCLGNGLRAQYRQGGLLGTIAQFTPHAHGLEAYRRLLLEGAGTADILPQFAVLMAMSVAFFLVAWWTLRFE